MLLILSCLVTLAGNGQNFGGTIKLKITYEDKPLIGYTITGSINGHDIGGKGVTDRNGDVTLYADPLPVPNIDVKGVSDCGNVHREWEASGFVYVSPTSNNNYYHLQLEQVAQMMNEYTGLPIATIMESFGLNCQGAWAGYEGSSSSATTNPVDNNTSTITSNDKDETKVIDEKSDAEIAQDQFKEDWASGKTQAEGLQNQKMMLENQIYKITKNISKNEQELDDKKLSKKEKNELLYDNKELELEKKIKEIKLERVNSQISNSNSSLSAKERNEYKDRLEKLDDELATVKENRKKGVSLVDEGALESETIYSQSEINDMSNFELKKVKLKLESTRQKKNLMLKSKGKIMKPTKKTALEDEIIRLERTISLLKKEIEKRGVEKAHE